MFPATPAFLSVSGQGGNENEYSLSSTTATRFPLLSVSRPLPATSPLSDIGPGHSFGKPYSISTVFVIGAVAGSNCVSVNRTPSCKRSCRSARLRHDQPKKESVDEVAPANFR